MAFPCLSATSNCCITCHSLYFPHYLSIPLVMDFILSPTPYYSRQLSNGHPVYAPINYCENSFAIWMQEQNCWIIGKYLWLVKLMLFVLLSRVTAPVCKGVGLGAKKMLMSTAVLPLLLVLRHPLLICSSVTDLLEMTYCRALNQWLSHGMDSRDGNHYYQWAQTL